MIIVRDSVPLGERGQGMIKGDGSIVERKIHRYCYHTIQDIHNNTNTNTILTEIISPQEPEELESIDNPKSESIKK